MKLVPHGVCKCCAGALPAHLARRGFLASLGWLWSCSAWGVQLLRWGPSGPSGPARFPRFARAPTFWLLSTAAKLCRDLCLAYIPAPHLHTPCGTWGTLWDGQTKQRAELGGRLEMNKAAPHLHTPCGTWGTLGDGQTKQRAELGGRLEMNINAQMGPVATAKAQQSNGDA